MADRVRQSGLPDTVRRLGVWPDSVQVSGGMLSSGLPTRVWDDAEGLRSGSAPRSGGVCGLIFDVYAPLSIAAVVQYRWSG